MSDLFLDVFAQDFIQIISVIDRKSRARGGHDDYFTKKLENLGYSLNTSAKGIGNE
jgi:hypothetical protein